MMHDRTIRAAAAPRLQMREHQVFKVSTGRRRGAREVQWRNGGYNIAKKL